MDGARDEFLAGTAFAEDEDGVGGVRDLREDAVELFHLGRVADEGAASLLVAQTFAKVAAFEVEVAALGGAFEDGAEFFEREGFGEVVFGAEAHGFDGVGDGGRGGHDDDGGIGVEGFDVFEQRESATGDGSGDAGGAQVHEDEIDLLVPDDGLGGAAFGGLDDGESHPAGDFAAGAADFEVFVDDEQMQLREAGEGCVPGCLVEGRAGGVGLWRERSAEGGEDGITCGIRSIGVGSFGVGSIGPMRGLSVRSPGCSREGCLRESL